MKILQLTLLASALILSTNVALSAPLDMVDAPQEVLGAVGSYLPLVAQSQQNTWELVKVATDQFSGTNYENGFVTVSGSYTVIHQLGSAVGASSGRYSWSRPNAIRRASKRGRLPDAGRSQWLAPSLFENRVDNGVPQSATRYFFCVLHEKAEGQDKFTDVHLVPNDWEADVLPAVVYLRAHPALTGLNAADPNLAQIRALLRNPNPYLVLTAIQLLAIRKSLTTADMDVALSSAEPRVVAGSLAVAQLYAWTVSDVNAQWMTERVAKINSLNQLEGIAVGLVAVSPSNLMFAPSPTTDLPDLPKATPALGQKESNFETSLAPIMRRKLNELDPDGGSADARWRVIDNACQSLNRQTNAKHLNTQTNINVR